MPDKSSSNRDSSPRVSEVLSGIVRNPGDLVWKKWNWKSALLSSLTRGSIFFSVNLFASLSAAVSALLTELVFRPFMSGFYGAVTEQFSPARPGWAATLVIVVVLPAINHVVELAIHWMRGTQKLGTSVVASIIFSVISGLFNMFAMRRGVLIVGDGRRPLLEDLRRVPLVIFAFLTFVPRLAVMYAVSQRESSRRNVAPSLQIQLQSADTNGLQHYQLAQTTIDRFDSPNATPVEDVTHH